MTRKEAIDKCMRVSEDNIWGRDSVRYMVDCLEALGLLDFEEEFTSRQALIREAKDWLSEYAWASPKTATLITKLVEQLR